MLTNPKVKLTIDGIEYDISAYKIDFHEDPFGVSQSVSVEGRISRGSGETESRVMSSPNIQSVPRSNKNFISPTVQDDRPIKIEKVGDGYMLDLETNPLDFFGRDCNHKWKTYRGFNESYQYCEKCNDKKALEDS